MPMGTNTSVNGRMANTTDKAPLPMPMGTKYVGEWKNGKKHGQGTETWSSGWKYVGEWREGKPWNITIYGKSGIIILKYVNGVEQK